MTSTPQQQQADALRSSLARAAETLAADPSVSPAAKQARTAKAFLDVKAKVAALAAEHAAAPQPTSAGLSAPLSVLTPSSPAADPETVPQSGCLSETRAIGPTG